jgi:hypothetical protein
VVPAAAARGRGLIAAAEGDASGAVEALEESLALFDELPRPFERARTLLALGTAHAGGGSRTRARAEIAEVGEAFDALEAPLWAQAARRELAGL